MRARPSQLSQTPAGAARIVPAEVHNDVLADVLSLGFLRNVLYRHFDARAPWGLDVQPGQHAVLYVVARGHALLELAGQSPLKLTAGQVAFLSRGAPHVLRDAPTTRPVALCSGTNRRTAPPAQRIGGRGARTSIIATFFERARTPPPLLAQPADVVILSDDAAADPIVAATIASVLAELDHPAPASVLLMQRLADVLVVQAMRALTRQPACQSSRRPGLVALSDPPIHEALSLMHARFDYTWSVAELAARVGLSRSGFAARFTELVGEPPLQYLARWRMMRAAELLRETDEPVGAIAARVGYESTPSFIKAFKRWKASSPREYRRAAGSIAPSGT